MDMPGATTSHLGYCVVMPKYCGYINVIMCNNVIARGLEMFSTTVFVTMELAIKTVKPENEQKINSQEKCLAK